MKFKRIVSLLSAAAVSATALTVSSAFNVNAAEEETTSFPYTIEGEDMFTTSSSDYKTFDENRTETQVWTSIYENQLPGYTGTGFAYLNSSTLYFKVTVPEDGMYDITARSAQILDKTSRQQTIQINGIEYTTSMPYSDKWTDFSFGMRRLNKGENTIAFVNKYGYCAIDSVTVSEAEFPDFSSLSSTLSDSNATSQTKSLMKYLTSVYGKHIISGQQEIYGGGNDGNPELEFEFIKDLSGKYPAIRGFDFMNYNPLYGWDDKTTERCIEWVNERGGIATASWHINVPIDFANYKIGDEVDWQKCTYGVKSDFNTADAIVEGTKENEYFNLAIKDLAEQLGRLQDAGVPIILRPLHEAEGNPNTDGSASWFWWGKAGAKTYVEIWKYLYNKLTDEYGLHNIIWEQNLYAWSPDSIQWYAGDDYVDIVGYDKYNTEYNRHDGKSSGPNLDAETSIFYTLVDFVNNNKMVSMAENDTVPSLENLEVEHAAWLYFCPWYGDHLMNADKNNPDDLKEMYQSDYCITLDELPKDLYKGSSETEPTTETDEETSTEPATETTASVTTESTATTPTEVTETTVSTDVKPTETTVTEITEVTETSSTEPSETESSSDDDSTVHYGDVNLDGDISIADAVLLNKYLVNSATLSDRAIANADCYKNGTADANDTLTILKVIVGTYEESQLPIIPETN
ncbi:MAG: glycosyl hydrolase [Oscillospiraceae bacterium]|nr:glycosyl hydrolase [Oscillospiraceae bacterium]